MAMPLHSSMKPLSLKSYIAWGLVCWGKLSVALADTPSLRGDACERLGCLDAAPSSVVLGTTSFEIVFQPSRTAVLSGDAGDVIHVLGRSTSPAGFPGATLEAIRVQNDKTTATFVTSDATTFLLPTPKLDLGATASWEIVSQTVTHFAGSGYSVILATPRLSFVTGSARTPGGAADIRTRTEVVTVTQTHTSTIEDVKTVIQTLVRYTRL
jgi:hypothetical protein